MGQLIERFLLLVFLACGTPVSSAYSALRLRTQARPAIEFVSGKEGLRPF